MKGCCLTEDKTDCSYIETQQAMMLNTYSALSASISSQYFFRLLSSFPLFIYQLILSVSEPKCHLVHEFTIYG
jgi:hypothetical protein